MTARLALADVIRDSQANRALLIRRAVGAIGLDIWNILCHYLGMAYYVYDVDLRTGERRCIVPTTGRGSEWISKASAIRSAARINKYPGHYGEVTDTEGNLVFTSKAA